MPDPQRLEDLPREALLEIAHAASNALSRYLDHNDAPGFPPGSCAWAMGRDLREAFERHGVAVVPFGELVARAEEPTDD